MCSLGDSEGCIQSGLSAGERKVLSFSRVEGWTSMLCRKAWSLQQISRVPAQVTNWCVTWPLMLGRHCASWCRKPSLCAQVPNWISETDLGEVEKNGFIALPGKEGHSAPQNCVSQPDGDMMRNFIEISRVGLLIRIRACTPLICPQLVSWWAYQDFLE